MLWEELGVEPDDATRDLAEQLATLAQQHPELQLAKSLEVPVWDGDALPELASLPMHSIVPYQRNNDFVGRTADLLALGTKFLLGDTTSVVVTGIGGVGKTQVAVEFAFRFGRYFPGGVYWLSFAQADSVAQEVASIGGARGMGLFQDAEQLTLAEQVGRVQQAWQAMTPRLLIFDNCEEEALLEKWLPVSGGCRILVTATAWRLVTRIGDSSPIHC